jgi:hypothetical protein
MLKGLPLKGKGTKMERSSSEHSNCPMEDAQSFPPHENWDRVLLIMLLKLLIVLSYVLFVSIVLLYVLFGVNVYCTVLHCTALYCTVLYCAVLSCTALHCTALH